MRAYGKNHGLDSVNWSFLTSGPKRLNLIRDLVRQFSHKFTKQGDGYQVHRVVTHVIDLEGRWRANFYGLKFQPINFVLFINALTNDIHGGNAIPRVCPGGKSKCEPQMIPMALLRLLLIAIALAATLTSGMPPLLLVETSVATLATGTLSTDRGCRR